MISTFAMTQGVEEAVRKGLDVDILLARHLRHDWGDVSEEDAGINDAAVVSQDRLHSAYVVDGVRYWVITDPGWEITTILLPEEY